MTKKAEQASEEQGEEAQDLGNSETGNAPGGEDSSENSGEKKFSQADLERLIDERLKRERKQADEKQKKAEEERTLKALEEQQQFRELADKHKARLDEIEPELETYKATLETLLAAEKELVPDHLLPLLETLNPAKQLEWIAANRDKLIPAESEESGKPRGVPKTPSRGNASGAGEERKREAQKVSRSFYRNF